MRTYIALMKWTGEGIRKVKESARRLDTAKKAIEAAGGKLVGFYLTMGRYDMVAIAEFPSDEVAAEVMLRLGSGGSIRTETMKAFTEGQYREIISKVA